MQKADASLQEAPATKSGSANDWGWGFRLRVRLVVGCQSMCVVRIMY